MKKYNYLEHFESCSPEVVTQQNMVMPLAVMLAKAERGERVPGFGVVYDETDVEDGSEEPDFDADITNEAFPDITDLYIAHEEAKQRSHQAIINDPKLKKKKRTPSEPVTEEPNSDTE